VGKTAIMEGLAARIVSKEVPEVWMSRCAQTSKWMTQFADIQSLHGKRVLSLDLSAIMAGSGIRGAFEEKFKALLRDIEEEAGNVICFIDEVRKCSTFLFIHTVAQRAAHRHTVQPRQG
jgi:ATP-dependent Clp protease ATP-binding subunit ClpB